MAAQSASRQLPLVWSSSYPARRANSNAARYSVSFSSDMFFLEITPAPPWITRTNDSRLWPAARAEVATSLISSDNRLLIKPQHAKEMFSLWLNYLRHKSNPSLDTICTRRQGVYLGFGLQLSASASRNGSASSVQKPRAE